MALEFDDLKDIVEQVMKIYMDEFYTDEFFEPEPEYGHNYKFPDSDIRYIAEKIYATL